VRVDDSEWSYAALDDATARVAALLRAKGLRPGDRVGIMLPNVPYFPIVFYGVLRAGGVVVPVNLLLKEREVTYYLHDSGATRILAWHGCAGVAETAARKEGAEITVVTPDDFETLMAGAEPSDGVADRDGGDTAVILYTSGTTGTPKGAELTHDNLRRNVEAAIMLFGLDAGSVVFGALPLFHAFGQTCAMNAAIAAGGCLTLLPRFTPDGALDIIERHGVTVFEGVPTMYTALLHHPQRQAYDVPALRVCASGGAALPVEVLHGFEEPFGCAVLEGYGLSETSPVASFNHPDRPRRPGSIPIEGVEMRVVDDQGRRVATGEVGEIVIRGHNVMKGYWNRPEATAEVIKDGWFHSGDMGEVRRGRVLLHRRSQEGSDHPGWVQRLSTRDRGGPLRASGGARGRRRGDPGRSARRGGRGRGRPRRRGDRHGGGAAGACEGAGGGVQVSAPRLARRRASQGSDREDPQARDHPARRARGDVMIVR
jgi:long-chain acyl-CoA synthetase